MSADSGFDSTTPGSVPPAAAPVVPPQPEPTPEQLPTQPAKDRRGSGMWAVLAAIVLFAIVVLLFLTQCTPRVPDVIGMSRKNAEAKLKDAGYVTGEVSLITDTKKKVGTVLNQAPEGGSVFAKGGSVDLVVVRGSDLVKVPDVTGNDTPAAQIALKAKGLGMNPTGQYSDTIPAGAIISQTPAAGTMVRADSAVVVIVSLGPAPATPAGSGSGAIGTSLSGGTGGTGTGTSADVFKFSKAYPQAQVWSSGGDIYIKLTPGAGTKRITSGAPWDTNPVLAPSGKYVAFLRAPGSGSAADQVGIVNLTGFGVRMLTLPVIEFATKAWYTDLIFAPSQTGTTPDSDWLIIGQLFSPDPNYNGGPGGRLLVCNVPLDSTWVSWNNIFRPSGGITFSQGSEAGSVKVRSKGWIGTANFFPYTGIYRW